MPHTAPIEWQIETTSLPQIIKHCPKCGVSMPFVNSQKFRVNANKKHLDVWLIYNCEKCDTSFNLSIYERISPKKLSPDLLEGYMQNQIELIEQTAFDYALHQRQKVMLDFSTVTTTRIGPMPSVFDHCAIRIKTNRPLPIRLDKCLSQQLGLSRSAFQQLVLSGQIESLDQTNLCKDKLGIEHHILIHNL